MNLRYSYLLMALVVLAGCGETAPYQLASVEGLVTLDGEPLPRMIVAFQPIAPTGSESAGPGSVGHTNDQGRFVLNTVRTDEPGAVVGPHRILISPIRDSEQVTELPARYNYETTLTFEVPSEGTTSADFALTSDP